MPIHTGEPDPREVSSNEAEDRALSRRKVLLGSSALAAAVTMTSAAQGQKAAPTPAPAPASPSGGGKPNILMIMADDIGWFNVSAYNLGMMGYRTPNIDRIAKEGALFTDWYGEQSCTAGRAAFITGQSPIRTGLTKVGLPGAPIGLHAEDMSVAEALKPLGYATGQFGKNHLGDRNEYLPTAHGFDEFFGNLISTPKRSRKTLITLRIRSSGPDSGRVAYSNARPPTRTIRPLIPPTGVWASR